MAGDVQRHASSAAFGRAFSSVTGTVYVLLALGWCALVGMLPLLAAWLLVPGVEYFPVWCAAFALSAPGIAALFAVFRDQPMLVSHLSLRRVETSFRWEGLPDWIATPYVRVDEAYAVFRPYASAYRRVGVRALLQGCVYGVLLFIAAYDAQIISQFPQLRFLGAVFLVCAVFLIQATMISLLLIAEYPKARWWSILKNGVMLSVRRIYILPLAWIAFIGYWWGLAQSTILVALLATGITAYVIWGSARWQADMLMVRMVQETGDESLIALYQGFEHKSGGSVFSSPTDIRQ